MPTSKINREDLLELLASIGVTLPRTTKLSYEELNKRVLHALDAAQQYGILFDSKQRVNPSDYPRWSKELPLLEAVTRMSAAEIFTLRTFDEPEGVRQEKKYTFREMRQTIMSFAHTYETRAMKNLCLMDASKTWGVYVQIVDVYQVGKTPLFLLAYKEVHETMQDSLEDLLGKLFSGNSLVMAQTTELERLAMVQLFCNNAKRLPADYWPLGKDYMLNLGLKTTFALPLKTLALQDVGKLNYNTGCQVCGKRNISRCVQCLSVTYCGTECQKLDWPSHKLACRSLKGGTWHTITFDYNKNLAFISEDGNSKKFVNPQDVDVPPDVHNGKIFLVKLQVALFKFGDKAHMLVYDRQRSFRVLWWRKDDPDTFDTVEKIIGESLKMFRWARRVADNQLSICFDRAPAQNPEW